MPAQLDQQTESPSRSLFGLGFREPETPADLLSDPIPSPASPPTTELLDPLGPGSGDAWPHEALTEPPADTSSPASTQVSNPLDAAGLRDVFRGGVIIAGDQAHNMLARTEGQQETGLYRTDEEDAQNIGDPLARIAGRHQGVGKVNPDTADLLAAMVGLTRYATKQIGKSQAAKQIDGAAALPHVEAVDL